MLRFVWVALITVSAVGISFAEEPPLQWFKGNLHTHTLWSDGDDFPEMVADWYRQHDYNFLALTDHNILSEGDRWMDVAKAIKRADDGLVDRYKERFGESWVQTRPTKDGKGTAVRLKPLDEFRFLLEERGKFIMIPAEEISDKAEGKPVHINATNLAEVIQPQKGATVREAIQNNLRAILEHEKQHGREVLPHVNHPNFHYAITAEDLAFVTSERFYEVYNGHPGVNQLGDDKHPSIETLWDQINAIRRGDLNVPPIMGIATDDSHEYHGKPGSRPGRGWVMVQCRYLTPEHLIQAMKRGDFYASSGVSLKNVDFDADKKELSLQIILEQDVTYQTDFIATVRGPDGKLEIGKKVARVIGAHPSYRMSKEDLYVRAVVNGSQDHPDPSFDGQRKQAWTQPVGW